MFFRVVLWARQCYNYKMSIKCDFEQVTKYTANYTTAYTKLCTASYNFFYKNGALQSCV